jgi:hypothetical protein
VIVERFHNLDLFVDNIVDGGGSGVSSGHVRMIGFASGFVFG